MSGSLTRRLVVSVLLAEFLCAIAFSAIAFVHEREMRRHAFDTVLRGRADSLLGAIQDAEDPEDNVTVDSSELILPSEDRFDVLGPTGRIFGHSQIEDPALLQAGSRHADGYFNFVSQGVSYRALRLPGVRIIDRAEGPGIRRPVTLLYASPTTHLWHQIVEAVRFYILLSVCLLAVTGILLAWLLRRGLSPLRQLAGSAAQVSTRNWEFLPPAETLRTPELAPIANAIHDLLRDLKQAFERERQFTGDAAHELKTSVAILKSSLQLLAMRQRTLLQYQAGLDRLLSDIERMEELIDRMLTLTRIREAPLRRVSSIHLASIIQALLARFQPLAEARQVAIELRCESPCAVTAEEVDIEILSSNLILNALQHSPPGSRIELRLQSQHGRVRFSVSDRGPGIPAEALPHVFERFFRADSSRSRRSGGVGLGLAICKAICERYGGSMQIECPPNCGTVATATLPATVEEAVSNQDRGASTAPPVEACPRVSR